MSETCYGQVEFARYAFAPTQSIIDDLGMAAKANWLEFLSDLVAPQDIAVSAQNQPMRQLDEVEQGVLHDAHMMSVNVVGGVIRP